jgi:ribosomal protein L29
MVTAESIPSPDAATTATRTRRPRKKSVRWMSDPEILNRLNIVAQLLLENRPAHEIAAAFDPPVGIRTIRRDIARVRELWKLRAEEGLEVTRNQAQEQYLKVIQEAWSKVTAAPERADRYLAIVISAQGNLDRLNGTLAPEKHELTGKNGGPIETRDIDEIRQRRWQQIAEALLPEEVGEPCKSQ